MQWKKIGIACAIAVVVISCVIAAGCTSNTTSNTTSNAVSDEKFIGTWTTSHTVDGSTIQHTLVIRPSNVGADYTVYNDEYMLSDMFFWDTYEKSNGTALVAEYTDGTAESFLYNINNGTLTSSVGGVYTRTSDAVLDSIVGTWVLSYDYKGEPATMYQMFKWDGTGMDVTRLVNGNTYSYPFTWEKVGDVYKLTYSNGGKATITLHEENGTISYKDDDGVYLDAVYEDIERAGQSKIIGTWTATNVRGNTGMSYVEIFNADKTGLDYEIKASCDKTKFVFGWSEKGNVVTVKYLDGDTATYTYDEKTDTLVYKDGTVLTREE